MSTRIKYLIVLILLMVLDTLPVPILGFIAMHVVISRPIWFREVVRKLYEENQADEKQSQE